jgi:phage-related protein
MGTSLRSIRSFPREARHDVGDQLLMVQAGEMPEDWKSMPSIGSGVTEIRVHKLQEYRVIYIAKFPEAVYVLTAFEKKSQKAPRQEVERARKMYAKVLQERKK